MGFTSLAAGWVCRGLASVACVPALVIRGESTPRGAISSPQAAAGRRRGLMGQGMVVVLWSEVDGKAPLTLLVGKWWRGLAGNTASWFEDSLAFST